MVLGEFGQDFFTRRYDDQLQYFVTKNYSDDYRIALSFNFKIKN